MKKTIQSLPMLRVFETVARTLSFTTSARELNVTQAAVSRQIRNLENQLSVKLINRSTSGINTLTDAGEILFNGTYRAFESINSAVNQITGSGTKEILNVSISPFFSAHWLTPRLMNFVKRYNEIDLRLHHSYYPTDHKRDFIDVGINWGSGAWPGVTALKVLDGSMTPVISPKLAKTSIPPNPQPFDITKLLLLYEFDLKDWARWFDQVGQKVSVDQLQTLRLSDSHSLRRAALDGHGVALFFSELLEEDIATNSLVRLFDSEVDSGSAYYLNYPSDTELPLKGRLFKDWVLSEMNQIPDG